MPRKRKPVTDSADDARQEVKILVNRVERRRKRRKEQYSGPTVDETKPIAYKTVRCNRGPCSYTWDVPVGDSQRPVCINCKEGYGVLVKMVVPKVDAAPKPQLVDPRPVGPAPDKVRRTCKLVHPTKHERYYLFIPAAGNATTVEKWDNGVKVEGKLRVREDAWGLYQFLINKPKYVPAPV